jgi:GABA(A) receptor-associated protein
MSWLSALAGMAQGLDTSTQSEASEAEAAEEKSNAEAKRILAKYPDRLPVVLRRGPREDLPEGWRASKKFLAPRSMLVGEFKHVVHKHLREQSSGTRTDSERTIYLLCGSAAPKTSEQMDAVYDKHRDEDGFLYMTYVSENTLGEETRVRTRCCVVQ